MEIYAVKKLNFRYPGQTEDSLRDVSFSVERGSFTAVTGPSGSGKSTLLNLLKPETAPHGEISGEICYNGTSISELGSRESASSIGFVMQDPDAQILTDKVWHELAFGLENMGEESSVIRRKTAEIAGFFGMGGWLYKNTSELSGGQKQLLNLASVMVMQPEVLILDEPTSRLDPIAASELLTMLGRINREMGTTVIISEHRLEDVFPICTDVIVLDKGEAVCIGAPREVGEMLREKSRHLFELMPVPMQIWASVESGLDCPMTVAEGRSWLSEFALGHELFPLPERGERVSDKKTAIRLTDAVFGYIRGSDVLRGLSLEASFCEHLCIMGGNGTGKSTLLKIAAGWLKARSGSVETAGKTAMLPQDVGLLFSKRTVREELEETGASEEDIANIIGRLGLIGFEGRHPLDLSGGERQRAALAKVLLGRPDILLLDEPTKGTDSAFKRSFGEFIGELAAGGMCIVTVSHDAEFCAEYADRCALVFDGSVTACGTPRKFFAGGSFYATAAGRMARKVIPDAVTASDVIAACGGTESKQPEKFGVFEAETAPRRVLEGLADNRTRPLGVWRKVLAAVSGSAVLWAFASLLRSADFGALLGAGQMTEFGGEFSGAYIVLFVSLVVLALAVGRKETTHAMRVGRKSRGGHTLPALIAMLIAVPLTVVLGVYLLDDRKYYFISLLVILETLLPFAAAFEGRKPKAREIVLVAVLCAIGAAGRAAFMAVPGFKPVMAIVIVTGAVFGCETGFFVGAVTMFLSNMMLGQGPWTPWQMLAMGLVGLASGFVFHTGLLHPGRRRLCVFGIFAAIVIYGGIMNPASVLLFQPKPEWEMIAAAYVTGLPMDAVHGASTAIFLYLGADAFIEKLDRVKTKYGIME